MLNIIAQRADDDDLKLLKGFDLNYDYGPNIGKLMDMGLHIKISCRSTVLSSNCIMLLSFII